MTLEGYAHPRYAMYQTHVYQGEDVCSICRDKRATSVDGRLAGILDLAKQISNEELIHSGFSAHLQNSASMGMDFEVAKCSH